MNAQELPYQQIPEYHTAYSSGNIVSRMIDGLGYRYHWATKGLTEKDLAYKPSEDGRSAMETLQHVYGLSLMIINAPLKEPNIRPIDFSQYTFEELRKMTLDNLLKASKLYSDMQTSDFDSTVLVFKRGEKTYEFPFWHMLNGPLADAIYHTGQIVMMRRSNGNPLPSGVDVFMGKTRE